MKLVKTSLINAWGVAIKMLCMLGMNKVLAVYVGPSGYAFIGQLQTFVQSMTLLGTAGTANGVVKYTSDNRTDYAEQREYWKAAGFLSMVMTAILSVILFAFSTGFSLVLFKDESFSLVFKCMAFSLLFFAFNSMLLSILNGMKEVVSYVKATIAGSVLALLIVTLLVYRFSLLGALIGLAVYQSVSFFATLVICYRFDWFRLNFFIGKGKRDYLVPLLKFSLMALTSALVVPMSQLMIRGDLIGQFGHEGAGYWEAIWRLSSAYLMFVTGVLTFYFLPRFSELRSGSEIKEEIINAYKVILPFMLISVSAIYLGRDFIVWILFSADFAPALQLLPMQLVGDVLKVCCWLVGFVMLGKALTKAYVLSEILFSSTFFILSYVLSRYVGLSGVVYAYCLNYVLYGIFLYVVVWRRYLGNYNAA